MTRHEGRQEKQLAEQKLAAVRGQWGLIDSIVAPLKQQRQDNHFADRLREIFADRRRR